MSASFDFVQNQKFHTFILFLRDGLKSQICDDHPFKAKIISCALEHKRKNGPKIIRNVLKTVKVKSKYRAYGLISENKTRDCTILM